MPNLKLKKSLAKENYVKTLVIKGTCEVKDNVVDYVDHKFDPQLVNDLMNFIEKEISKGKYSKKDFDKSKILQDIVVSVFGNLSESELKWLENTIQHIIDNKLVKKKHPFFKRFRYIKKSSYDILKISIRFIDFSIKIICNEKVQSVIPLLQHVPFCGITSVGQLVVCGIGPQMGLSMKVILIILLFL